MGRRMVLSPAIAEQWSMRMTQATRHVAMRVIAQSFFSAPSIKQKAKVISFNVRQFAEI